MVPALEEILRDTRSLVFFGGAGVSTESNIPDFRSEQGLYHAKQAYGYAPEEILSHTFFMRHTETFFDYYKHNLIYSDARPNKAHLALAYLERQGKLKAIVTQNIDGLHQAAGSKNVLELHGSTLRNYCEKCGKFYDVSYIKHSQGVPRCTCGGRIKPDVVLYEEALDEKTLAGAISAIRQADMLLVGGTSLTVYPAAGLLGYYRGDRLALINRDETPYDDMAGLVLHASLGDVFSQL